MQGHVRKRGSKWCAVVYMGLDANGKRKYKWFSGYNTKKEAQRALVEKIQEVNTGAYVEPTKVTVRQFVEIWLEARKSQVRPVTHENNERLLRNHIIPHLGNLTLSKLRGNHVQSLYSELQSNLSPASIQTVHNTLHVMIRDAVKWEYIARDIMQQVTPPRAEHKIRPVWDFNDVQAFNEAVKSHELYVAFTLAVTTGMRRSEILGLKWDDIDFEQAQIHVQRSLKIENGEKVVSEVKTSSSRRTIVLFDEDVERLREHRKKQLEQRMKVGPGFNPENLVFVRADGSSIRPTNFSRDWTVFLKKNNLPHIPLHSSRHTHATLLLALGIHPKVVQERLGHSSIRVTMDLYSHILPGMQEDAVKKLENRIFKTAD
ncbi:site-specific integrase [Alicyclobacillus dauci]|uniref:Site-specific integrase n=1 Tax=Alicyclobacillus dauci TaxID=1475485 RepID=A0ABY6YXP9_9BACL|nr:site-specific integrase [Alicyclobacillus dauci]WAH34998.1 site-specific integrase [Alicyclobacillus dauci]